MSPSQKPKSKTQKRKLRKSALLSPQKREKERRPVKIHDEGYRLPRALPPQPEKKRRKK
jgi:hypothetical protein